MSSENIDMFTLRPTPREALENLEEALRKVMWLQLELYDALKNDIGYSLTERLRLRFHTWKQKRLMGRICDAINNIPEYEVPDRHPLIERELGQPVPTDLKGALDELATMEDGESLFVGHLSRGQYANAYGRARKRGFVLQIRRALHSDHELTRVCGI